MGSIGVLYPFETKEDIDFSLEVLEDAIAKVDI